MAEIIDRAPLGAKDAAAAGLINGTMHKLDAMHRILHVNPAHSSGQAPETSAESHADADTDAASSEEARRSSQVETGAASAAGSTASTSGVVPNQARFTLQNAAQKATTHQLYKAARQDQEVLAESKRLRQGYRDPDGFEYHSRISDICQLMPRKDEGTADAAVKSNTGCIMISLNRYAAIIQHEACMAAEKAAKTEAKPTVAIVHIQGKYADCVVTMTTSQSVDPAEQVMCLVCCITKHICLLHASLAVTKASGSLRDDSQLDWLQLLINFSVVLQPHAASMSCAYNIRHILYVKFILWVCHEAMCV